MKIILIGYGRMGHLIEQTAVASGDRVVAALDIHNISELAGMDKVADVVIDFSNPASLPEVCAYIRRTGTPLLSGTTGHTPEQKAQLIDLLTREPEPEDTLAEESEPIPAEDTTDIPCEAAAEPESEEIPAAEETAREPESDSPEQN